MLQAINLNYRGFKAAVTISLLLAIVIIFFSFYLGKHELFFLINGDLGKFGDFYFNYYTFIGDAALWIIWFAIILFLGRKQLLPLIISAFIFQTLFTQVCKQFILPKELRPTESIKNFYLGIGLDDELQSINAVPVKSKQDVYNQLRRYRRGDELTIVHVKNGIEQTNKVVLTQDVNLHLVPGVTVHSISSFPSGHSATAFTFALLLSLLSRRKLVLMIALPAATCVGYSRVYLGQHFPLDVGGGIIVAAFSVSLAIWVHQWWMKRQLKAGAPLPE